MTQALLNNQGKAQYSGAKSNSWGFPPEALGKFELYSQEKKEKH